ncbi:GNAT family N-acetyltransferase [Chachezhania antarctica]|uniref:GNAT family N-acetyltransferase n=1 Tax=Chachezhania antarctica TaxID=2340860 RepID=UPI000EAD1877|nr:GNAT family N-acetyltransferase [Chachezhania antarctica]|tara:strand:- start:4501 stop:4965 length:465 start_codon:yes stop_codon:yes gene_type:complete
MDITFTRLTKIPLDRIAAHMSDPRVVAHMPLAVGGWDAARCAAFVDMKEGFWTRDGLGHWAFLADGAYVGWGGFQKEGDDWDFGLVLTPDRFGLGQRIAFKALDFARADPRIPYVTFLLPLSRKHLRALDRLGARPQGEIDLGGARFRKFFLPT